MEMTDTSKIRRTEIADILKNPPIGEVVLVKGWVRAFRNNQFVALNDGSSFNNLQVVLDSENMDQNILKSVSFHACIAVTGKLVESSGAGQAVEIQADEVEILGTNNLEEYPLQAKKQTMEFLRENAQFRMRTNTFSAVFRIRHAVAFAVNKYFHERGFYYMHTPIITGSDAEGAGEMFRVTTLDVQNPPLKNKTIDDLANNFYLEIESAIKKSKEFHLTQINDFIEKYIKDYNLEKIVKARPSDIKYLQTHENIERLNSLFNRLYQSLKIKIFHIKEENGKKYTYLKKKYGDKLKRGIYTKKEFIRLRYDLLKKKHPFLCLTFYNINSVARFNQLSNESELDFSHDFFKKSTNLTVSGQLQAEIGALSMGKVYTFGPTFRAENSHTSRHLAEFWMIEPEVAFADIYDDMDLAEDFCKYLINYILDNYPDDLAFLDKRIKDMEKNMKMELRRPMGLIETLKFVVENDFERITYTDAINLLKSSKPYKKGKFKFPVEWGLDLSSEHERWLVEKKFKKPVIVRDYPKDIKAFYMRMNDDNKTVAAMDVLFPGIGEVVGGSQREERLDLLKKRMAEMDIHEDELSWYLDLRKFGGTPHAGFGLGFERMILFITGMSNIRDVIPFPRTPGNAEF